jgi:hypothetical protein
MWSVTAAAILASAIEGGGTSVRESTREPQRSVTETDIATREPAALA